jgi:hypothetical protein
MSYDIKRVRIRCEPGNLPTTKARCQRAEDGADVARKEQNNMAVLPEGTSRHDPRRPVCDPSDPYRFGCPLNSRWREWDLGNCWRDGLPSDAAAIAERSDRVQGVRLLGDLNAHWTYAFDDPSRLALEAGNDLSSDWPWMSHIHTELVIDHRLIHIDWVSATKSGPGRSLLQVRIFIDGVFAGHGGSSGASIGSGDNSLPAVALIGSTKALVVDGKALPIVAYQDSSSSYARDDAAVQRPLVRLWKVEERIPEKRSNKKSLTYVPPPFMTERDRKRGLEYFERLLRDEDPEREPPVTGIYF